MSGHHPWPPPTAPVFRAEETRVMVGNNVTVAECSSERTAVRIAALLTRYGLFGPEWRGENDVPAPLNGGST